AYLDAGGDLTATEPSLPPSEFVLDLRRDLVASIHEVKDRPTGEETVLLDARAPERYRGEVEPLDPRAGHIPGAKTAPFTVAMGPGGLLAATELAERLGVADLVGKDVIAYCGSGVSAAHLILALEEAGLEGVRLYPGSWSEWSSDPDRPVATGSE